MAYIQNSGQLIPSSNLGRLSARFERIERIERVIEIDDSARAYACSGGDLHMIGEDVSERLDIVRSSSACSSRAVPAMTAAVATKPDTSKNRWISASQERHAAKRRDLKAIPGRCVVAFLLERR